MSGPQVTGRALRTAAAQSAPGSRCHCRPGAAGREFEVFNGIFQAWGIDIGFSNCDVLYDMAGENGTQFEDTYSIFF